MRKVSRDHVSKKMLALSRPLPQQTVLMSIVDTAWELVPAGSWWLELV